MNFHKCFILKIFRSGNQRSSFWELRDEPTDAAVICENGKFETKVHKTIMAAASPFFRDELKMNNIINLSEVSNEEVCSIVEFIYAGEVTVQSKVLERFFEIATNLSLKISEIVTESQQSSLDQEEEEKAPKNVFSLPSEILGKIFSYIPTHYLLQNVALVSKYFNQLTKLPKAHINVTLKACVNKDGAAKFLENKTLIRQLKAIDPIVFPTLPKYRPFIRRIRRGDSSDESDIDDKRVSNYDYSEETYLNRHKGTDSIVLSVCNHPHFRALELCGDIAEISFKAFIHLIESKCWKNLTRLSLYIGWSPGYETFQEIRDIFNKGINDLGLNFGLKKYSLFGEIFDDDEDHGELDNHVRNVIQRHKNTLEELSINDRYSYNVSCQPFELCHRLKSLEDFLGFDKFEMLPRLTNLTSLELGQINVLNSYEPGTLPVNSLPKLRSLTIETADCEDSQKPLLEALADACPNLKIFAFTATHNYFNLTSTLKKIVKTCSKLEKLQSVVFGGGQKGKSIEQVKFHKYLPNLKFLQLDGWNLSFEDTKRILRQSSNLEVLQCQGIVYIKANATLSDKKIFCQNFQFPMVNDLEIICKVEKIC